MTDERDMEPEDIIQMIPATGWWAVYDMKETKDGKEKSTHLWSPLVAWALLFNGDVVPLDADTNGSVEYARGTGNLLCIRFDLERQRP